MRRLPPQLVDAVRRAQHLEQLSAETGTIEQRRNARQALNTILLAAVEAGWRKSELAPLLGVAHQTISNRVAQAQQLYGTGSPALIVDAPPAPRPRVTRELDRPADDREWLTRNEAAALVGCSPATIRNWRAAGLLPHTRTVHSTLHLFLRADVLRIAAGEQYRNHGINWTKARAALRSERMRERLG